MKNDSLGKFGKRLKSLREEKNLSQEKLADLANLDRTYISFLERGKRNPSLLCLFSIANALDVSLSTLCDFKIEDD